MIVFRKDTTFPFLALARRYGVPYEKVLRFSEDARLMQATELENLRHASPLWDAVVNAMDKERKRRTGDTSDLPKIRHRGVFIERQLQGGGGYRFICHTGISKFLPDLYDTQAQAIEAVDAKLGPEGA